MNYVDFEVNFENAIKKLPVGAQSVFSDRTPTGTMEGLGGMFDLTYGVVGWLCELTRQLITKEIRPEDFEAKLKEKLDEDNWPILGNILVALNEQVLSKILPIIGIAPITITAPVKPIEKPVESEKPLPEMVMSDAGIEFDESKPTPEPKIQQERPVPIKKFTDDKDKEPLILSQNVKPTAAKFFKAPTSATPFRRAPVPPQPLSEFSSIKSAPENSSESANVVMQARSVPKAPIIETNTQAMSENPIGSFMKMLSGKMSEAELQDRFEKLPLSLKNALRSVDSAKKVADIGRKYALHIDKLGDLGEETALVVIGMTHPGQFLGRLSRKLDVGDEKAKLIAQEINTEIFLKIREALKQVNGEMVTPAVQSQPVNLAPTNYTNTATLAKPEQSIDRESLLRDIEGTSTKTASSPVEETEKIATSAWFKPNQTPPKAVPKPAQSPVKVVEKTEIPSTKVAPITMPPKTPTNIPPFKPAEPVAKTTFEIPKVTPPEIKKPSIIDQKLSAPTSSPKFTSQYSGDPYREPLE